MGGAVVGKEWSAEGCRRHMCWITHGYPEVFVNYFVNARRPGKSSVNSEELPIILIEH